MFPLLARRLAPLRAPLMNNIRVPPVPPLMNIRVPPVAVNNAVQTVSKRTHMSSVVMYAFQWRDIVAMTFLFTVAFSLMWEMDQRCAEYHKSGPYQPDDPNLNPEYDVSLAESFLSKEDVEGFKQCLRRMDEFEARGEAAGFGG